MFHCLCFSCNKTVIHPCNPHSKSIIHPLVVQARICLAPVKLHMLECLTHLSPKLHSCLLQSIDSPEQLQQYVLWVELLKSLWHIHVQHFISLESSIQECTLHIQEFHAPSHHHY